MFIFRNMFISRIQSGCVIVHILHRLSMSDGVVRSGLVCRVQGRLKD